MSDPIDRQAAINAICKHGTDLERIGIPFIAVASHKQVSVDLLEALPTVDTVEVVRCKDCKWHMDNFCGNFNVIGFGQDDYCSMGERRSDE